jgi:hypothetical protein
MLTPLFNPKAGKGSLSCRINPVNARQIKLLIMLRRENLR